MKVSIVGSGYVGTTTALCLSELGHDSTNIDIDEEVVSSLNQKELHLHEDGLQGLLDRHGGERFRASTDYGVVPGTDLTFLALTTPSRRDGSIDLSFMEQGAESLGKALQGKDDSHVVAVKSTVVPGSAERLGGIIADESGMDLGKELFIASNPEFLREGTAVKDFLNPDKIVIGGKVEARETLKELYSPLLDEADLVETGIRTAEMVKYVNNSLLATKISFANEIGNLCKELNVDTYEVMDAVGLDNRIERSFLDAGAGFGGSCFPKDVSAIAAKMRNEGVEPRILGAALKVNEEQPTRIVDLLEKRLGELEGKTVAVLGLAFKPGTDDVRESRSIPLIEELLKRGSSVKTHDPKAEENMKEVFPDLGYAENPEQALDGAEACVLMTDWPQYRDLEIEIPCIEGRRMGIGEGVCW